MNEGIQSRDRLTKEHQSRFFYDRSHVYSGAFGELSEVPPAMAQNVGKTNIEHAPEVKNQSRPPSYE